ncbi:peptide-methionine (S)-S-oxide reductase MsrA [Lactiplantibacillus daowaiensis]|uniref:Peptide methionine sulfoxide reductase MsrA n=1 Tax=Lactiplantibacillus daowaiensis TaxID=2559918 RepID=A0ABW1RYU0_9LACO|nr:peptide-methionine (S)-S-oxide reductase MsrA [Lactiplantibacillus daowaiensis]
MTHDQSLALQNDLYNLILNPATRAWERQLLVAAKARLTDDASLNRELDRLAADLRPLAQRNSLTPDVTDFYAKLTGETVLDTRAMVAKHWAPDPPYQERAIFAGGCFWCLVEPFETRAGVNAVISGYTGGALEQPTYEQVFSQTTGHVEAVEILFDRRQMTYADLLAIYWQLIDPTDDLGQIDDRGTQYRPVIFVNSPEQRQLAKTAKQQAMERYQRPIVVGIEAVQSFWPAENFHQQFYQRQPKRYRRIKHARQQYLFLQRLGVKWHQIWHH